jgi:Tol biopolymer transport system component
VRNYFTPYVLDVTNVDVSSLKPVTSPPIGSAYAKFSPDGGKIVFSGAGFTQTLVTDIYPMSPDGSNPTPLTSSAGSNTKSSFSPDGRTIVFVSSRVENLQIYAMSADGSHVTRLTNLPGGCRSPAFSADGRRIAFACVYDDGFQIYRSARRPLVAGGVVGQPDCVRRSW